MMRRADAARHRAKAAGRATYAIATATGDLAAHRPPPPRSTLLPATTA